MTTALVVLTSSLLGTYSAPLLGAFTQMEWMIAKWLGSQDDRKASIPKVQSIK
jgi:hypothetical protein